MGDQQTLSFHQIFRDQAGDAKAVTTAVTTAANTGKPAATTEKSASSKVSADADKVDGSIALIIPVAGPAPQNNPIGLHLLTPSVDQTQSNSAGVLADQTDTAIGNNQQSSPGAEQAALKPSTSSALLRQTNAFLTSRSIGLPPAKAGTSSEQANASATDSLGLAATALVTDANLSGPSGSGAPFKADTAKRTKASDAGNNIPAVAANLLSSLQALPPATSAWNQTAASSDKHAANGIDNAVLRAPANPGMANTPDPSATDQQIKLSAANNQASHFDSNARDSGAETLAFAMKLEPAALPEKAPIASPSAAGPGLANPGTKDAAAAQPENGKIDSPPLNSLATASINSEPAQTGSGQAKSEKQDHPSEALPSTIGPAGSYRNPAPGDDSLKRADSNLPAAASQPTPGETKLSADSSEPVRNVLLQLKSDDNRRVDIRMVDRGGELHVSVKSGDSDLAQRLQEQMPELTSRLDAQHIAAEVYTPKLASTRSDSGSTDSFTGGERYSDQRSGNGAPSGDHRRQQEQQNRPDWVDLLESTIA